MESGTANLLNMLQARVKKLCEDGNWNEAMHAAKAGVDKARAALGDDRESQEALAVSLENFSKIDSTIVLISASSIKGTKAV